MLKSQLNIGIQRFSELLSTVIQIDYVLIIYTETKVWSNFDKINFQIPNI